MVLRAGIVIAEYLRALAQQRCSVRHTHKVADRLCVKGSRQLQAHTQSRIVEN
jgi:hypothetical protein